MTKVESGVGRRNIKRFSQMVARFCVSLVWTQTQRYQHEYLLSNLMIGGFQYVGVPIFARKGRRWIA